MEVERERKDEYKRNKQLRRPSIRTASEAPVATSIVHIGSLEKMVVIVTISAFQKKKKSQG